MPSPESLLPSVPTLVSAESRQPPSITTRYRLALIREADTPYDKRVHCRRPVEAARFVQHLLQEWDREVGGCILLKQSGTAIGHVIAYIGTKFRAAVEPRGFLAPALLGNATGIIMFHNHPSGDATPSRSDIAFSGRLSKAAEILGLTLVDSLIVTPDDGPWASLRLLGHLPGSEGPESDLDP